MVNHLWVIRHGQSTANVAFAHAAVGRTAQFDLPECDAEVPLSKFGELQAAELGLPLSEILAKRGPCAVFCSPYRRARQTLQVALAEASLVKVQGLAKGFHEPEIFFDERLRDREMGDLELLPPNVIKERFPEEWIQKHQVGVLDYLPPGGESLRDVKERLITFWVELEASEFENVLLVGHDATVLLLRWLIEDLTEADTLSLLKASVYNSSISSWARVNGCMGLVSFNDVSHLKPELLNP
jgi:probable phosphoglycerate mutase